MKKEFATITTLRLESLQKDKLERIINARIRVTARTKTGAVRQMVGQWEELVSEVDELEFDNRMLRKENDRFREIIESYVATTRAMQAIFERKRPPKDKNRQATCGFRDE